MVQAIVYLIFYFVIPVLVNPVIVFFWHVIKF